VCAAMSRQLLAADQKPLLYNSFRNREILCTHVFTVLFLDHLFLILQLGALVVATSSSQGALDCRMQSGVWLNRQECADISHIHGEGQHGRTPAE
jgi:hypothetical protein